MIRIAINGFGRIGKTFLRVLFEDKELLKKITIVAINVGKADVTSAAYMFKYDTTFKTYQGLVEYCDGRLCIDGYEIELISELDATKLPWKELKIDWVVDASGAFTKKEQASKHLKAGAKKVLITAPSPDADIITIIPGVNVELYHASKHDIVSLASCTTNALMPTLKVIHDALKITQATMTTIHAYTNTQALLDVNASAKDLRRSRAAACNIVPSSTGAQEMIGRIMPELAGKVMTTSLRVPVPDVSLIDLTFTAHEGFSRELLLSLFTTAARGYMKGIVAVESAPLVSSDYCGNSHSVIIDEALISTENGFGKVFGWYDNEWDIVVGSKIFYCRYKKVIGDIARISPIIIF